MLAFLRTMEYFPGLLYLVSILLKYLQMHI